MHSEPTSQSLLQTPAQEYLRLFNTLSGDVWFMKSGAS